MKKGIIVFILMLGLVIPAIYYNTLDNEPTNWDDSSIFSSRNDQGITVDSLKQVLTYSKNSTFQPVRDISYMFDFTLWKDNVVFGLHLQNIVWYFFMMLALWLFLLELFRAFGIDDKKGLIWASASTLIFAVHPVHSEAVAWLMARKEPLMGTFTFLCLWSFLKARQNKAAYLYSVLSFIFLLLAILSKPIAVILPALLIMLDLLLQKYNPQAGFWKKRIIPYLAILLIAAVSITGLLVMAMSAGTIKLWHGGTVFTNIFAVSQIFISYISLIGFTFNYCADYPITLYAGPQFWQAWVFIGLNVVLACIAGFAFMKKRFLITFFIIWFYVFLLPVCHIFPIYQKLADRYAMMSSLSWCVLLGFIITWIWNLKIKVPGLPKYLPHMIASTLLLVIAVAYSAMTIRQNGFWQNSETLWTHTLAYYPNSNPANNNLSVIMISTGHYKQAKILALNAVKEIPTDWNALTNLAVAEVYLKEYGSAAKNFKMIIGLNPKRTNAWLGLAYALWLDGKQDEAIEVYKKLQKANLLSENDPQISEIYYRLAYGYFKSGNRPAAEEYLEKALVVNRNQTDVLYDIAQLYIDMNEKDKAIAVYERILSMIHNRKERKTLKGWITVLKAQ
jgi:protein O-mannosyl-transferase